MITPATHDTPPDVRYVASRPPYGGSMSTPSNVHRSADRAAQVNLRFSYQCRDELKRRAAEAGLSVQQYADWKLLGMDPNQAIGGRAVGQRPLEGISA